MEIMGNMRNMGIMLSVDTLEKHHYTQILKKKVCLHLIKQHIFSTHFCLDIFVSLSLNY